MDSVNQSVMDEAVTEFMAFDGADATSPDGRHVRRETNRNRVIDALLGLFSEGHVSPTVSEIAMRAEVSERSVFRYFDDFDDLARTAFETRLRDAFPYSLIPRPWPEDAQDRLELLVETRAKLFEYISPVASVSRAQVAQNPELAQSLRKVRGLLRTQIAVLFEAELSAFNSDRDDVLFALDIAFAFESWHLIRSDQERTVIQAKKICHLAGLRILELS